MVEKELEQLRYHFEMHHEMFSQAKDDFDRTDKDGAIYSLDFAVLYPYIVPRAWQRNSSTDPLSIVSNNIFLLLNDRVKEFSFDLVVPFATTLEIIEHFDKQNNYFKKVSESPSIADSIRKNLITGSKSAEILEDEILRNNSYIPADDSYKCLNGFVEHLKEHRLNGYGDHFDMKDFREYIKKNGDLEEMKRHLLSVRNYNQTDPNDRAFHIDVDALHLLLSRFFNDKGTLYTGPSRTRRSFGNMQKQYSRNPKILLTILHAINQSPNNKLARKGAESFLNEALSGFKKYSKELKSVDNLTEIAPHIIKSMAEFDAIYRSEMFLDRRKVTNLLSEEELKKMAKSMTPRDIRDSHRAASERLTQNVSGLKQILEEEVDEDLKEFLSPEGENHVDKVFKSFEPT